MFLTVTDVHFYLSLDTEGHQTEKEITMGTRPRIADVDWAVVDVGLREWIFIRLEDSEGLVGYGEATLEGQTEAVVGALIRFSEYLKGQDPSRINHHWQFLYRGFWKGGDTVMTALSAVEIALWDLAGKRVEKPVYELFGGAVRDSIRVYTHLWGADEEEIGENAKRLRRSGWRALKTGSFIDGFDGGVVPHDPVPRLLERMSAARDAVGDEVDLYFDCHGRFGYTDSMRLSHGLADLDFGFIEEPVGPENLDQVGAFSRASPTPVALGERVLGIVDFARILVETSVAYIQPDVCRCGGVATTYMVGALADMRQVRLAPHNPLGPVATAAAMHVAAASHAFSILEIWTEGDRSMEVARNICDLSIEVKDGSVGIPSGPGLGIALEWGAIKGGRSAGSFLPRVYRPDGTIVDW